MSSGGPSYLSESDTAHAGGFARNVFPSLDPCRLSQPVSNWSVSLMDSVSSALTTGCSSFLRACERTQSGMMCRPSSEKHRASSDSLVSPPVSDGRFLPSLCCLSSKSLCTGEQQKKSFEQAFSQETRPARRGGSLLWF